MLSAALCGLSNFMIHDILFSLASLDDSWKAIKTFFWYFLKNLFLSFNFSLLWHTHSSGEGNLWKSLPLSPDDDDDDKWMEIISMTLAIIISRKCAHNYKINSASVILLLINISLSSTDNRTFLHRNVS